MTRNDPRRTRVDQPRTTSRFRRRGSAYVFFLSTAMLVTIIGLSALTVVRVKLRAAEGGNDGAAARLYAQSAIEQTLLTIYADTGWRDTITHDTWSTRQAIGRGNISWKLADECNLSLTKDRNAPVRVYGQGGCGESVWLYSVLVQPPLESLPSNIIVNGDFETAAVTPWAQYGGCVLQIDTWTPTPNGGAACLLVTGRTAGSGASQALAGLTNGATCRSNVWVKMNGSSDDVWFGLWVQSDAGWEYFEFGQANVGASWTQLSGTTTPTWSGTLVKTLWVVGTDTGAEFNVDDASLVSTPAAIGPLPGTWRREAQ